MLDGQELVDSHCHLDHPRFAADELDDLIAAAGHAGIGRMVTICTRRAQLDRTIAIAERYAQVFFAAGIHPHHADEVATVDDLIAATSHPKMVGIGETGLDYHYGADSRQRQIENFHVHIKASQITGHPLIIHARAADEDMIDLLSSSHGKAPFPAVLHCFSSGAELARCAIELGLYLSMSAVCTFKRSDALRAIFRAVPKDRLLIETDAPYLAPHPHRGKRNQPAFLRDTAQAVAVCLDLEPAELARLTTDNFERLFPRAVAPHG